MEFSPADPGLFRASIDAIKEFLPQAQLHISKSGIRIRGMDSCHVCFVDYFLSSEDCTTLNVEEDIVIGVQAVVLSRILAIIGPSANSSELSEFCCLTLRTSNTLDTLVISYINEMTSKICLYEIPLVDISEDCLDLPDITYAATVYTNTTDIANIVKEVAYFGDTILFRADQEGIHIAASGDHGKVKQTLEPTKERVIELSEEYVEASFSTKYIQLIMRGGTSLCIKCTLDFDQEHPLRATFHFGKNSHYCAYLAPKISDD